MSRGRLILLAALSGAAAALGHAPFGLWYVSLAGFAVLIRLIACGNLRGALPHTPEYFSKEEAQFELNARVRPTLAAWAGGVGYFAVALHWIVEPFLVDAARHGWMAPFALVLMASGLALFWGVAGWLSARMAGVRAVNIALALALVELARGYVLTGFPWALPAYIWADTWLLSLAATLGPYGLTTATLVLAAMLSDLPRRWLVTALVAICLAGAGFYQTDLGLKTSNLGMVRLVQPNAPQDEKWDPEKASGFVRRTLDLSRGEGGAVDLIVWPETAVPYPLDLAGPVLSAAARVANGVPVITGINRRTETGDWFNSLIEIGPDGLVGETYDKVHLVPFGEYIPLRINFLRAMAGFSNFGFSAGEGVRLVETPLGAALPLICYEAIFPMHGAGLEERPDYLLQITNDAWFGTFSGPYQHLDQARFRAVEQGVPLIRAANTGVSAVIDPHGRIVAMLPLGEAGFLDAPLPAPVSPTLYARTGDWPVGVILFLTLIALFVARRRNDVANRRVRS